VLYDISGKSFFDIGMSWNLFYGASFRIFVNIMFLAMSDKNSSKFTNLFKQKVSFHAGIRNTPVFLTCSFFCFASS